MHADGALDRAVAVANVAIADVGTAIADELLLRLWLWVRATGPTPVLLPARLLSMLALMIPMLAPTIAGGRETRPRAGCLRSCGSPSTLSLRLQRPARTRSPNCVHVKLRIDSVKIWIYRLLPTLPAIQWIPSAIACFGTPTVSLAAAPIENTAQGRYSVQTSWPERVPWHHVSSASTPLSNNALTSLHMVPPQRAKYSL